MSIITYTRSHSWQRMLSIAYIALTCILYYVFSLSERTTNMYFLCFNKQLVDQRYKNVKTHSTGWIQVRGELWPLHFAHSSQDADIMFTSWQKLLYGVVSSADGLIQVSSKECNIFFEFRRTVQKDMLTWKKTFWVIEGITFKMNQFYFCKL